MSSSPPGQLPEDFEERSLRDLKSLRTTGATTRATRTSDVLPLTEIEPEVFERVIAETIEAHDSSAVHLYGRRGQAQYGLDIVEERSDGTRVLYQVKRFEEITSSALREAVSTYAGPARRPDALEPARRFHPSSFVVVTSAKVEDDTALVDCIGDLQDEYRGDLAIDVWGAETVSRRLRKHRGLVAKVFSDAWAGVWCGAAQIESSENREKRLQYVDDVLRAAMSVQFGKDNDVRFRQVDLTGISVESLFVDVPASSHMGSLAHRLIEAMNPPSPAATRTSEVARAGAAQALLHPSWTDSAVIVGGPGQGKTTLLQYMCQFHRARCLGRDEYSPIAAGLAPVTRVNRIPIKIELTEYAVWRRKRLNTTNYSDSSHHDAGVALLSYIAETVATDSGLAFSPEDLALAIAARPMIIALDGLDEIANTTERADIADQVRTTNGRIKAVTRGVMVLVATRPGNVGNPIWRDPNFSALFLGDLTPGLRMKYLERWTAQSKLTSSEIVDLRQTFVESISYEHVVELAGNPMQLAILLNLMQRRAVLPEKRTTLYDRYIEVFMDRESKSGIVAANKDVIVSFHKLLGWHIHTAIELGKSTGTVGLDEMRGLLSAYLSPRGYQTTFVEELFDSVTTRVLCLVQRELDSQEFQFEVQPLREYFAAEHLYDVSPNDTATNNRQTCLAELIRRPYWTNVMRFFAGKFSSGEVPAIPYALRALQADKGLYQHPVTRTAAKHLLDDRVLGGQLEMVVADVVKVVLDGPGTVFAVDGLFQQDESIVRFQERGGLKQAVEFLADRLVSESDLPVLDAVVTMLCHLGPTAQAIDLWWRQTGVEPGTWLRVAAGLKALHNVDASHRQKLSAMTERLTSTDKLVLTLVDSGASALDDSLVSACLTEIGNGIDGVDVADPGTPYGRLAAAASAHRYYEHHSVQEETTPPPPTKRHRGRVRSTSPIWNSTVQNLERAHGRADWGQPEVWHGALDTSETVFGGDCWALREAILALPRIALSPRSSTRSLAQGSPWRDIAHWRAEATAHRSSSEWFIQEANLCADRLARMSFVVYSLTTLKLSEFEKVLGTIDGVLGQLGTEEWTAISAALHRYSSHSIAPGELSLTEALRLGRISPSARLAVLLWHLSNHQTKTRLQQFIMPSLSTLWNSGFSVASVAAHVVHSWEKKMPASLFEGARSTMPAGTLRSTNVTQLSYSLAEQILSRPHDWPTDLVRVAVDRLSGRLANQEPIGEVAFAKGWAT